MKNTPVAQPDIDYRSLFKALPGSFIVLSPDFRIIEASEHYLSSTHTVGKQLIGKYLFDIFPESDVIERLGSKQVILKSLKHVLENKAADAIEALRFDVMLPDGRFAECYWDLCSKPVLDSSTGEIQHILHEVRDVTELVKKEHKTTSVQANYQEMNERFERIAKATSDVIWDWNLLTNQVWWNDGFTSLFGYLPSEIEPDATSWTSRIHPEDLDRVSHSIHHAIELGENKWNDTYRFRCADGSYKTIFDQGYIILNEQGQSVRMLGAMQDVTEKVKIEQQLKEQTEYTLKMLNALPLMTWTTTPDGAVNFYSQQWYEYTGSNFEEMRAWGWSNIIHPDDAEETARMWKKSISTGETFVGENRWKGKDGNYKWFLARSVPMRDSKGNIIMWVGSHTDIEDQKQMMAAIESSKERFKMLAESIPHIVWSGKPDGYVDYFNQQWYDYTKMTEEETLGLGWSPSLHPDDLQPTVDDWLSSMRTGQMYERELRLRDANTENYRWFLARALPIRDAAGNIITWYGTATDIHDQKVLREQVEASEKKFRFLTESIPQMVWSANPDGYIDYTNHRWFEYTKMDENSLGFGWAPAIHPDELDSLMSTWLNCVATGEKLEFQVRFQDTEAKTYRWFLLRAEPMYNDKKEIVKWFGTATDIHDQRLLQEQLQESEQKFRFLTESIPQMVWTANADGAVDYFNNRWINYTGLSLEESLGPEAWLKVLHPDDVEMALNRWLHSVHTGDYYEIEYRIRSSFSSSYRWFLGQGLPMRDNEGNVTKWFGTCTDIEDHKKAEEELLEKNIELERTNQDLDSFVYTASHDLKLPILNMAGIFEELTRVAEFKDPDAPKMINMFNRSLHQIQNTIDELSEVVKVQKAGRKELEYLDLQAITQDVLENLQHHIEGTQASITTNFSAAPYLYFTRPGLKSILYNLISNAIKYKSNEKPPVIHLNTKIKDNFVELQVSDNGIGLDLSKHHNKLFQMFRRFHNHVNGSGLGLYIVNRLLTNQGGYINIESQLNKGTTFYLYFKQKKA
ncbi:PAS domain S-box-containing protein [Pontibacter aydingkolensis]|uniref:histidine kinase n=1 Tax=Pontibacter aydingkolensis TaxID=1911536 RepID=A0ABS7CQ08_9BACT|nr:PAS domain-containing protein [Pontibacter aydingkolensis]MBW7465937.1 PAS domain-containing protein [Pontibacter aydingkolensis]